ncbi:hypothetical protein CcaverHIS002_0405970 [Cutaneotrichosporon cavernicola]|uniref:Uncharacterized protein n=1 Tax=Cutaneotrichosporon cavernicola TaxID=279322 RepID=A0AA48L4E8_9TREE|nr:uncharacterized protein CcaverHIS019_0405990 [Cutaneotrichosporon cavernicola]BEI83993.1 hypothetical protein CcaverHIS002_0405970 [Cutaneotrichosporon cavernicola]BEI91779.1 hypothetical protein CcaverHIS019_0405990 [Cutaneotrichosporon cavernicola]BEI99551.1 hypothetical protein CcaverHIS631_0405940 [Cutaneotrichosporon cavernicola]BEJ07328.1 hypothetical protein CcaverHIS641_0405970 [Cutaneotrichosporon cavernicola]
MLSPRPRSAPTSPLARDGSFTLTPFPDRRQARRKPRTVQVSAYGDLSWSQEASDLHSRPPRLPLTGALRSTSVTLAPISEEHKDQRGTGRPLRPPLHASYTPSSLGPRRLPPVEALVDVPDFGLGRRRERSSYMPAAIPPPISTPRYPDSRCSETPSPRTPSPPVTPETPDIDTRRVRDNMDDLNRKFAQELCM